MNQPMKVWIKQWMSESMNEPMMSESVKEWSNEETNEWGTYSLRRPFLKATLSKPTLHWATSSLVTGPHLCLSSHYTAFGTLQIPHRHRHYAQKVHKTTFRSWTLTVIYCSHLPTAVATAAVLSTNHGHSSVTRTSENQTFYENW